MYCTCKGCGLEWEAVKDSYNPSVFRIQKALIPAKVEAIQISNS